jgi:hypothetical protein
LAILSEVDVELQPKTKAGCGLINVEVFHETDAPKTECATFFSASVLVF